MKKRNLAKVKILRERPERLQIRPRKEKEQEEESTEWWEIPNARPDPVEAPVAQDPLAGEAMALQPADQEEAAAARGHRDATKEAWQVAMGPWRQKNTSPGPKERKRRQQEARRRDKEQARHPYRLRSRKGQEDQVQEEERELSD